MRRDDIMVEVRDRTLARRGSIPARYLNMNTTLRDNDVDTWTLTLPGAHAMAPVLMEPGSGIIVYQREGTTWDVLMSGPTDKPNRKRNRENPDGTLTFSGVSDDIVLADALAYGDPANAADAQTAANDTRTGAAQDLLHGYVEDNLGASAPSARRVGLSSMLTVEPSSGLGPSVTKSPRFQNLLELAQELATLGGLRFRVLQEGTGLVFRSEAVRDRTDTVRLDIANGTLESEESQNTPPTVTSVLVAGQGEGTARTIVPRASADALAAEALWGRRVEVWKDARGTEDPTELAQAGDEMLEAGKAVQTVRAIASDDQTMRYGRDWVEGDLVAVVIDGVEYAVRVTAAAFVVGPDAVLVGASVGNVQALDEDAALKARVEDNDRRISSLERTSEGASGEDVQQAQDTADEALAGVVPTGALMPYAGTGAAPSGWLKCDGQAVSRTTYAALFAALGTTYGAGNGSTTFNVPDLRGRVAVGAGGSFDAGDTGGADTVTLTTAQMPSHSHSFSATTSSDSHSHSWSGTTSSDSHNHGIGGHGRFVTTDRSSDFADRAAPSSTSGSASVPAYGGNGTQSVGSESGTDSDSHNHSVSGTTSSDSHSHSVSGTTGSAGSGSAVSILQPYAAVGCHIIKT